MKPKKKIRNYHAKYLFSNKQGITKVIPNKKKNKNHDKISDLKEEK